MDEEKQSQIELESSPPMESSAVAVPVTKDAKKRKPRMFPQFTLEESVGIPRVIAAQNAGNPWAPEQISDAVGVKSNAFFYLTSASRDYGFTTGTSRSRVVELTPLGRKIAYPESPKDEKGSVLAAFLNIELFSRVYSYYKGKLPETKYLRNTLKETFNVDPAYHDDFIKIFTDNLSYLDGVGVLTGSDLRPTTEKLEKGKSLSKDAIFVIMPFNEKTDRYPSGYFDEVFSSLIVPAAAEAGLTAQTAQRSGSDIIHSTIVSQIHNAEIIIADLTEHNPNVLFELGLAIAFKKKVALIRSKGTAPIFDVDNLMRVYDYDSNLWKSTVERDVPNLTGHIQSTLSNEGSMYLDILLKK